MALENSGSNKKCEKMVDLVKERVKKLMEDAKY